MYIYNVCVLGKKKVCVYYPYLFQTWTGNQKSKKYREYKKTNPNIWTDIWNEYLLT